MSSGIYFWTAFSSSSHLFRHNCSLSLLRFCFQFPHTHSAYRVHNTRKMKFSSTILAVSAASIASSSAVPTHKSGYCSPSSQTRPQSSSIVSSSSCSDGYGSSASQKGPHSSSTVGSSSSHAVPWTSSTSPAVASSMRGPAQVANAIPQ